MKPHYTIPGPFVLRPSQIQGSSFVPYSLGFFLSPTPLLPPSHSLSSARVLSRLCPPSCSPFPAILLLLVSKIFFSEPQTHVRLLLPTKISTAFPCITFQTLSSSARNRSVVCCSFAALLSVCVMSCDATMTAFHSPNMLAHLSISSSIALLFNFLKPSLPSQLTRVLFQNRSPSNRNRSKVCRSFSVLLSVCVKSCDAIMTAPLHPSLSSFISLIIPSAVALYSTTINAGPFAETILLSRNPRRGVSLFASPALIMPSSRSSS